jgi:hypothetical protein
VVGTKKGAAGRAVFKIAVVLCALWAAASAALYGIMRLPPETFAGIVAKVPAPVIFAVLPFQRLWGWARGGSLSTGDLAPDFDLKTHDGSARVRLSEHRGKRPVVLVFGSYT